MKIQMQTFRFFSVILFFLCIVHVLPAQNNVRRRFTWTGDDFALKYEVVIQKQENMLYKNFLKEFTNRPSIEVSLQPGKYRMRVIPYDFRDTPAKGTNWMIFEVDTQSQAVIVLEDSNSIGLFLNLSLMPFFPLYYGEGDISQSDYSIAGIAFRAYLIFPKEFMHINPGVEFAASSYSSGGKQTATTTINFLAQKRHVKEDSALTFRAGIGYTFFPEEIQASAAQSIHANLGLSFSWMSFELDYFRVFFEAGLDYTHYFTDNASGCFRPWIGIGAKF